MNEVENSTYVIFLGRAGKSPSRSSSVERPSSSNPYVRQGSLKAWKEEQDKVKAEEEEKERQKQEKRARSAEKKKVSRWSLPYLILMQFP